MDTKSLAYKKAFNAYMRFGTPIAFSLEQDALQTKRQGRKAPKRTTTHYIWRTAGDGKVRSSHAANNGKIFAWDDPPPTGHPGEDYGCRCTAEPYTPENVNQTVHGSPGKIKDSGAALAAAIKNDWTPPKQFETKAQQDARIAKLKAKKLSEAKIKAEEKKREQEAEQRHQTELQQVKEYVASLSATEQQAIHQRVENELGPMRHVAKDRSGPFYEMALTTVAGDDAKRWAKQAELQPA